MTCVDAVLGVDMIRDLDSLAGGTWDSRTALPVIDTLQ